MQFKTLTLLTLAAVATASAIPGRASAADAAIKTFTEDCKTKDLTVICCNKPGSGASEGKLTGNLNGAEVTCNVVPSYVLAGNLGQTQAQCSCGLGCCSPDAIQAGAVDTCSGFVV